MRALLNGHLQGWDWGNIGTVPASSQWALATTLSRTHMNVMLSNHRGSHFNCVFAGHVLLGLVTVTGVHPRLPLDTDDVTAISAIATAA
jgi:hypothetical protein